MFFYKNANGLYSTEVEMFSDDLVMISENEYNVRLEVAKQKRVQGEPIVNTEDW